MVEPVQRIRVCPLGLAPHRDKLCPVHAKLDEALALIERTFRDTTIAELLGETGGPRITVDDGGAALSATARRAFLTLEVDPGTHGRASSVPLYVGAEIAAAHGARVELADSPLGGLRVEVTFART